MNVELLVKHLKPYISDDVLALLISNQVPLTGPTGLRRWLAERDVEYFAKAYFPDEFTLDLAPIHQTFVRDIEEIRRRAIAGEPGVKLARAIPRGHSKTTFYSRLMPLHGLLFGWSPLTVLLANNATAARRLLRNIREACETNDAIAEDFDFSPGTAWGDERLEFGGSHILCFGRGSGAIRGVSKPGQRPSLIIGDDLDDDASVSSAVQLASDVDWLDKAVMSAGDQVGFTTAFVFVGTIIKRTSLMQHVLDNPDFHSVVEQGIKKFSDNPQLWDEWRTWFLEQSKEDKKPRSPDEDEFYQQHRAEMLAGTEVLWDSDDRYYHLQLFRLAHGDAAFFSEIQNNPSEAGGNLGQIPWRKLPDDLSEWQLLAALDPTIRGGRTNDKAAWIEAYFHRRRKEIIIAYCNAEQRPSAQTVEFVLKRLRQSVKTGRYDGLWVESNSAGTLIADSIRQRATAEGLSYAITEVQNSAPKDERISILSEYASRGQLFVAEGIDPEFAAEWENWLSYRFDDALDAASTIVEAVKKLGLLDLV